jgi:hypothetical protein
VRIDVEANPPGPLTHLRYPLQAANVSQQFRAGPVCRTSCRDADDAKLHRAHGTRHTLQVGAGQFSSGRP